MITEYIYFAEYPQLWPVFVS